MVFEQAYRGGLQMRARAAGGEELGRSEATFELTQYADSAGHLTLLFDSMAPLGEAARYTLHQATPNIRPEKERAPGDAG